MPELGSKSLDMLIPFQDLFRRRGIKPAGVLHLGANSGQEAQEYQKVGVPKVIWVEAIPKIHQELVRNVERIPGHVALRACVGDEDGKPVTFHVASNGGQSSSVLELGTHKTEHPSVHYVGDIKTEMVRVDTLLLRHHIALPPGPWFLNADLQGAELMALKGMGNLIWEFQWAYLEVNERPLYVGCPLVGEIDEWMAERGFRGVETKMTGFGWGDKLFSRTWTS